MLSLTLGYDNIGRITDRALSGSSLTTKNYANFYDELSRLVRVEDKNNLNTEVEGFEYDANGNRTESRTGGVTDSSWTYDTAGRDELQSYDSGNVSFTYDVAGNITGKTDTGGTTTYAYNAEGRLSRVEFADTTEATYLYDHAGRRVRKYVESTAETKRFLWSGDNLIAELDDTGIIERRYLWTGFEPVAIIENTDVYYYHSDQLGTPQVLTDSSGAVVWSVEMDAFGNATETGSIVQPWRFPGQYYDEETGWHYNRYRYYLPLGIYNRLDPARSGHLYAYAGGNPLSSTDPMGLTLQSALNLVAEQRSNIIEVAGEYGIEPILLAGVVFSENQHPIRNIVGDVVSTVLGNNTSYGIAQMNLGTACVTDSPDLQQIYRALDTEKRRAFLEALGKGFSSIVRKALKTILETPIDSLRYAAAYLVFLSEVRPDADHGMILSEYNRGFTHYQTPNNRDERFRKYRPDLESILSGGQPRDTTLSEEATMYYEKTRDWIKSKLR